jgi:hypothetical protein
MRLRRVCFVIFQELVVRAGERQKAGDARVGEAEKMT